MPLGSAAQTFLGYAKFGGGGGDGKQARRHSGGYSRNSSGSREYPK